MCIDHIKTLEIPADGFLSCAINDDCNTMCFSVTSFSDEEGGQDFHITIRYASVLLEHNLCEYENGMKCQCFAEVNTDMFSDEENWNLKDKIMVMYY